MNHDIDHCPGYLCLKRDSCLRFLAGQEAIEKKMEHVWWMSTPDNNENCVYYLEK